MPVKDTTEKTNDVALVGGIAQILASPVPTTAAFCIGSSARTGWNGTTMVAIIEEAG